MTSNAPATPPPSRLGAEFNRSNLSGTVMLLGFGDLAQKLATLLSAHTDVRTIVAVGRNAEAIHRDVNLLRYTNDNARSATEFVAAVCDLYDSNELSKLIQISNPDVIVNCASVQSWRRLTELPKRLFEAIDEAQFGPWLPMHLAPALAVYSAYADSNTEALLVNCGFPDAVNPIISAVHGHCKALGAGNAANLVPALRFAMARLWTTEPHQIQVLLAAQHYVSHRVPRSGDSGDAPLLLGAYLNEQYCEPTPDQLARVLHDVAEVGRRRGGINGQLLTASSVLSVVAASYSREPRIVHSPGAGGLPGGYPVSVSRDGWDLHPHPGHTVEELIEINTLGQQSDGIASIDPSSGVALLQTGHLNVLRQYVDYPWDSVGPADVHEIAHELHRRFNDVLRSSSSAAMAS